MKKEKLLRRKCQNKLQLSPFKRISASRVDATGHLTMGTVDERKIQEISQLRSMRNKDDSEKDVNVNACKEKIFGTYDFDKLKQLD